MTPDVVVLLGFGGPENRAEIRPFLDRVLRGRPISPERYELVVSHYERLGGRSPFNELTRRQAEALHQELLRRGRDVPVRTAYLNAAPFVEDVAREIVERGDRAVAIILAAFQSDASWQKYAGTIPGAAYVPPYFDRPLFMRANAERLHEALRSLQRDDFRGVELIFTAHSIPQALADRSPYAQQFHQAAELIAAQAGAPSFRIAYQSRSGSPREPWLEPDVRDAIAALPQEDIREAIVAPIGFLCDHVEILYDLDVDARAAAAQHGVRMARAAALNDHPLFIAMLADLVEACAA
jgi:ferrochelatase